MTVQDFSQLSMIDLFRVEAENQTQTLTAGLLLLERNPHASDQLEACMRAAHSLKGAARIIDLEPGVVLGHAMEECFVAAQDGRITLHQRQIDILLHGVDLLLALARKSEAAAALPQPEIAAFLVALENVVAAPDATARLAPLLAVGSTAECQALPDDPAHDTAQPTPDRMLRVTAGTLNRLVGLAGEQLMEARRLKPFAAELHGLKRLHRDVAKALDQCRDALPPQLSDEPAGAAIQLTQQRIARCQEALSQHLEKLDALDRRGTSLAGRIYDEALACRMRPFEDGVRHYPRLVRDLGRSLGKQVRLELIGASTSVDRDILDRLDAPLGHMLRNAIDHGIETPEARTTANKPAEGVIRLEARHVAGLLQIVVADDGGGIDLNGLRMELVRQNLATENVAKHLSDAETAQFLFLPGFSMKAALTAVSGRGVGLDVVQTMVKEVRGIVRVTSQLGHFTRFQLELPLTLSVIRTVLVQIDNEPYAFPLAGIMRTVKLESSCIETAEGLPHFTFEGQQIGLVAAHRLLEAGESGPSGDEIAVVVVGDLSNAYGLVVDRFLGERELVVVPLDPRLGKVACISAAALMEDGSPVLILDVEDMLHAAEKLAAAGRLGRLRETAAKSLRTRRKRVLVVDDSLTVRELERKLLAHHGYDVEIAVDGMDGWNAVRAGRFDLVITDVDMPRMDGIELVGLIKKDPVLRARPVMIVSYKDREVDRVRGLDAGADYYLVKSNFQDVALVQAVVDLIGDPES
jgi:two-component system sensor histidine kinase and response regulator WspE